MPPGPTASPRDSDPQPHLPTPLAAQEGRAGAIKCTSNFIRRLKKKKKASLHQYQIPPRTPASHSSALTHRAITESPTSKKTHQHQLQLRPQSAKLISRSVPTLTARIRSQQRGNICIADFLTKHK